MRTNLLSLGATVVLLVGCAAPSQRDVDASVADATRDELPGVSSAWQMASGDGSVQVGWIESFQDPLLTKLVAEAQANNPSLAAAAANVSQSQALARQAGASLLPDASLTAGSSRSGVLESGGGAADSLSVGVQVGWELDLWGRIRSGVAQAANSAASAEADYRGAQNSLAANTAVAYFAATEASLQSGIASESLTILERTARIVQAQYDEGVASAQDLALTKSDVASAKDQVVALEGSSRDALRALELLLGRYPKADVEVKEQLSVVPPAPPAGVPSEILERRPDLVSAERQVAAAFNALDQAKAARLPTLSLTGTIGGSSTALSEVLDPANVAWSLGSSLLAPLFDGGRRRENVEIANAQQEAALARYADAALRAFVDVEGTLDQGEVLKNREVALSEAADQAAKAFRVAELRYREGETSLVDLLSIQQRLIGSRSSLIAVQRLLLQQRVNLNLALGGGW